MPRSRIKESELKAVTQGANLDGDFDTSLNCKVSKGMHRSVYNAAHLVEEKGGMSAIVRKALVMYLNHLAAGVGYNTDPEWDEIRSHIWYARGIQARENRRQWIQLDHENAQGIAQELQRIQSTASPTAHQDMMDYVAEALEDINALPDKRRESALDVLRKEPTVRSVIDAIEWRKSMMAAPADPDDVYEQEADHVSDDPA